MHVILALILLALTGCSTTVGNPLLKDPTVSTQIKSGVTTKADVQALLGAPLSTSRATIGGHSSDTWGYTYVHSAANPLLYVPLVNLVVLACCQTYEREYHSLIVSFGPDDTAQQVRTADSDLKTMLGASAGGYRSTLTRPSLR